MPTGVFADTRGRRTSYLLGTFTLAASTILYLGMWYASAPFWAWALASVFLGLGFTFFSGAVQAWLVDALKFSGHFDEGGQLEDVIARGEIVEGAAMLGGSVAGGLIVRRHQRPAVVAVRPVAAAGTARSARNYSALR